MSGFACMYVNTVHVCSAHRDQKGALDSLELEFYKVVSYHVGAENQTWALCKRNHLKSPETDAF